jgi:hypothetical protein
MGLDCQPKDTKNIPANQGGSDPLYTWSTLLSNYDPYEPEYTAAARALRDLIHERKMWDQFTQLVDSGPVWDGNLISKKQKKQLLHAGLAQKTIVEGKEGYTTSTSVAIDVRNA